MKTPNRRTFFKLGLGTAGALITAGPVSRALASACGITPPQTPGPFYPGGDKFNLDTDLTWIPGHSQRALGQVIYVKGIVVDEQCRPVKDANVEIWQACASGKYNNPRDPNTAPLDPNFRYWAETYTNEDGEYAFKSILPGEYPADTNWVRPAHIHFKITRLGYRELVTQMYFSGNPLNEKDLILRNIPASERESVIVDFQPSPEGFEPGSLTGNFDITIQSVRNT